MRAKVFFYLCAIIAIFLGWRLYKVQVIDGPVLAREALAQRSDTVEVFARRGSITDRDGNPLVRSLPSQSVYAVPHDITDVTSTVAKLQPLLGKLSPDTISSLADKKLWFVWLARKVSADEATRVKDLGLAGIALRDEDTGKRVDMAGKMASTLVGFVGTDENGLDGLEYSFDKILKGDSGRVTLETDEFGRPIPLGQQWAIKPAQPGYNVELTLDSYLQYVTEAALGEEVSKYHALDGTAIVMDPYTGEVLAMANLPNFDPNKFWKYKDAERRDRGVTDAYEPGSTFKLVTAAAALESGKVNLQSRFPARDSLEVGGHVIHNAEDGLPASGGTETLQEIIELSHNVGAAEVAMRIGGHDFYEMEQKSGFGAPTNVELPGENPGIIPAPADWSDSSLATMAFGQGVSTTPLAMARYYCAIANGGLLMRPRVVHAITNASGKLVYQYPAEVERRVFSEKTASELRGFLRAVVLHGTGKDVAEIPGYTTAGKTGTAEMVENGRYEPGAYAASFIGMIPYEHPRFVVYVKVERPIGAYYGGIVAAPAFDKIARAAMLHAGVLPKQ